MEQRAVIDTNVFVSAIMKSDTAPRQVLRLCLLGRLTPLMGTALFLEAEAVLSRADPFRDSPLTPAERGQLFDAYLAACRWVPVYYLWRPNLPDEADSHLVELAVAGQARWLVTGNTRDFANSELLFPELRIATPAELLHEGRETWAP